MLITRNIATIYPFSPDAQIRYAKKWANVACACSNYQQTVDYLFRSLPMYHRVGASAYKASLDNTFRLDEYFKHPHTRFKTIHIAGTNGKGSVSNLLAAVLQKSGYKTGLYTSPHLLDFRERISVNGELIPEQEVVDFVAKHSTIIEAVKPSFFETTVAMAFDYFERANVDVAVIEVGLGGRLDSTNIITPMLSVITNIGLDHTQFLGNTLEKIAFEKAGIIKPAIPVVIGETQPTIVQVFKNQAMQANAAIHFADQIYSALADRKNDDGTVQYTILKNDAVKYNNLVCPLGGLYQHKNIATTLMSLDLLIEQGLKIGENEILSGINEVDKLTGFKGRWQIMSRKPLIICDVAHNADGLRYVVEQLRSTAHQKLHFIFGLVNDKDTSSILNILPREAVYYFTKAQIPRALNETELANLAAENGLNGLSYPSVEEAFLAARSKICVEDMIFVGGSFFIVAEFLAQFTNFSD